MKRILLSAAVTLGSAATSTQAQTWNLDKSHSKVKFSVSHMLISEVEGKFKMYDGKITSTKDDFSDATIEFNIDVNSIDTDDENRDKHLKGDDFFNAEKFPNITFKGKSMKKVSGKNYKLTGELTMRDVTKTVEFDVVYNGTTKDPWGNTRAGFKVTGKLNRMQYGLKWNAALETGGLVVGEEVSLTADIEIIKQK